MTRPAHAFVAMTDVWYRGASSSSAEIDPANVAVKFPAFFVVEAKLETCLAHGQVGGLQTEELRDTITAIRLDDCPAPNASDQAALDLFASMPKLAMDGEQLTITSPNGTQLVFD